MIKADINALHTVSLSGSIADVVYWCGNIGSSRSFIAIKLSGQQPNNFNLLTYFDKYHLSAGTSRELYGPVKRVATMYQIGDFSSDAMLLLLVLFKLL